ncbi:MAG: hypothetical protein WCT49_05590 [Candidatus Paceibacterota bacterium]|jgi:hypothetical protein|nr:hypothetical protein [Candidatus Paceibacterota bacterium]
MTQIKKYLLIATVVTGIGGLAFYAMSIKTNILADNEKQSNKVASIETATDTTTAKAIETAKVSIAPSSSPATAMRSRLTTIDDAEIFVSHAEFPPEVDTVEGLLSISDNVFIGKIVQRVGFLSKGGYPTTQYSVNVLSQISGNAEKNITLTQGGVGLSDKTGHFYVNDEDISRIASDKINPEDIYLKTGATYLFATGYNPKTNIYGISCAPLDRELITTDNSLSSAQLLIASENNPRVKDFMRAAGVASLSLTVE